MTAWLWPAFVAFFMVGVFVGMAAGLLLVAYTWGRGK